MTDDRCEEMHLLIQADVDGELNPADAARVGVHVAHCAACAETQERLLALSARLRREAPRYPASDALRAAVQAQIAAAAAPAMAGADRRPSPVRKPWLRLPNLRARYGTSFGAGFALAACLALALILPQEGSNLADAVVTDHIRALQPGHLMDVVSTDQHTVKPWFDGRLDFAPPVKDLAAEGFPLAGGRLDYLAGRPVAALVYHHRQHVIDLFVWPAEGSPDREPVADDRNGYNVLRWTEGKMAFWAVSDLNAQELADFVRRWRAM